MRNRTLIMATALVLVAALPLAGCQTAGGSAGTGAALGAGIGAIIGNQSGKTAEGAAIGAAIGALGGYTLYRIKARKTRSAQETAQRYEYRPNQAPVVSIDEGSVSPGQARAGDVIRTEVEYALLGTGASGVTVTERRLLERDGEILMEISSETFQRDDGTWTSELAFEIPNDLSPGQYALVHFIETPTARVTHRTEFAVIQ